VCRVRAWVRAWVRTYVRARVCDLAHTYAQPSAIGPMLCPTRHQVGVRWRATARCAVECDGMARCVAWRATHRAELPYGMQGRMTNTPPSRNSTQWMGGGARTCTAHLLARPAARTRTCSTHAPGCSSSCHCPAARAQRACGQVQSARAALGDKPRPQASEENLALKPRPLTPDPGDLCRLLPYGQQRDHSAGP